MSTTGVQDGFRPVHDAHAIEQVAVSIQFITPLGDDVIRAVGEAVNRFSDEFPNKTTFLEWAFRLAPTVWCPLQPKWVTNEQALFCLRRILVEYRLKNCIWIGRT
jgi:hypothetical protein